ncbi:MAG TPA: VWA domain-containing protein [Methanocella sp.]|nr:VWA domain-containing protein [Methanocella sp.]
MIEFSTFEELLDDEEIREAITLPRNIPRRNREEIAEVLYREIVLGEDYEIRDTARFIGRFGVFYLILVSLKGSGEWERLKALARESRISSLIMLRIVLTKIFDLLDDFSRLGPLIGDGLPRHLSLPFEQFKAILESTLELWHRRMAGALPSRAGAISLLNFDEARFTERVNRFQQGDASRQFLHLLSANALLADILDQVSEVERHLPSLEMLSLLYPGRNWDHSMLELHRAYFANLHKYSKIVERSEDIRKILDHIGRIEMEYGARRLSMVSYSRSEMHSVTTSSDLQHMLPVESVKLKDETLKSLFFAKWMEGKLLTYQLTGKNWAGGARKKRGPMVAMVDTSGSMHGAPEVVAKAIILALVRRMLRESRDVKVFLFSSVGQTSEIELTDMRKMAPEFLDFLNYTFEGGTDFNTALREGLGTLEERQYRYADILFITDGLSVVSDEQVMAGLDAMKKNNGNWLFTIVIGNDDAGGMDRFSDHVFVLSKSDVESSAAAIKLISTR